MGSKRESDCSLIELSRSSRSNLQEVEDTSDCFEQEILHSCKLGQSFGIYFLVLGSLDSRCISFFWKQSQGLPGGRKELASLWAVMPFWQRFEEIGNAIRMFLGSKAGKTNTVVSDALPPKTASRMPL